MGSLLEIETIEQSLPGGYTCLSILHVTHLLLIFSIALSNASVWPPEKALTQKEH